MGYGYRADLATRELALGAAEGFGGRVLALEQGADGHHHLRARMLVSLRLDDLVNASQRGKRNRIC